MTEAMGKDDEEVVARVGHDTTAQVDEVSHLYLCPRGVAHLIDDIRATSMASHMTVH